MQTKYARTKNRKNTQHMQIWRLFRVPNKSVPVHASSHCYAVGLLQNQETAKSVVKKSEAYIIYNS